MTIGFVDCVGPFGSVSKFEELVLDYHFKLRDSWENKWDKGVLKIVFVSFGLRSVWSLLSLVRIEGKIQEKSHTFVSYSTLYTCTLYCTRLSHTTNCQENWLRNIQDFVDFIWFLYLFEDLVENKSIFSLIHNMRQSPCL